MHLYEKKNSSRGFLKYARKILEKANMEMKKFSILGEKIISNPQPACMLCCRKNILIFFNLLTFSCRVDSILIFGDFCRKSAVVGYFCLI